MISIIAAIGKNNELGKGNDLLWHMPADFKHFKDTTTGSPIIMGRKTFLSIGKPLPGRKNIVITRDKTFKQQGIEVVHSLKEALETSRQDIDEQDIDEKEVFVIGGGEIYKQAMEVADKLYITHVDMADKDADTFFPEIIPIVWNEVSHEEHKKDDKNPYNYTFSIYEKFF